MSLIGRLKGRFLDCRDRVRHAWRRSSSGRVRFDGMILPQQLPKVYVYELPRSFTPNHELPLVSETYFALYDFMKTFLRTEDPEEADYFLVPVNVIQYQFRNESLDHLLSHLRYFDPSRKDHLLIALGDYSQRSKQNHFGHAYRQTYTWIDNFVLLALESTTDLIAGQDVGLIPFNTLSVTPTFNRNRRRYLYSFLGQTHQVHLPASHIRNRIPYAGNRSDVFVGSRLSRQLRTSLRETFPSRNEYELLSRNSIFTLAPAGYGRWTYRFFQAIQWGSIPVLLSDQYLKPFSDTIPYDSFCVTIPESEASHIDEILRSFSCAEIARMQQALEDNLHHFTRRAFFAKLSTRLAEQSRSGLQLNPS